MKTHPPIQEPVPMLELDQVLSAPGATILDLRSPEEFASDHLPGALSAPLFGDLERSMVGFLYRQVSAQAALQQGEAFAMERVRDLAHNVGAQIGWQPPVVDFEARVKWMCSDGIQSMERRLEPMTMRAAPESPVVLHCMRGGLRSRSVVSLMRGLGLERAVGLAGGYKRYRRHVIDALDRWDRPPPYVLHGLTGVGKTGVLRAIEVLRPGWTLDLEQIAGHRSSLLGMVGMQPCNQKTFDSGVFQRLQERDKTLPQNTPLVIEGESRKVGDVTLPKGLWGAMQKGVPLWLEAPTECRVRVLMEDYLGSPENRAPLRRQLQDLAQWLPQGTDWVRLFDSGQEPELVRQLLADHYDPLYRHASQEATCVARFSTVDWDSAARAIIAWVETR